MSYLPFSSQSHLDDMFQCFIVLFCSCYCLSVSLLFSVIVGLQHPGVLVHGAAWAEPSVPGLDLWRETQLLLDDRFLQPAGLPDSHETGTHDIRLPTIYPQQGKRPDGTQREKQAHSHIYTRMQTCTDIHRDLQVAVVIFLQCMKFILHSDNMLNLSLNPIPVVNSAGTSMVNGNFCMKLPFLVFLSDHFYLLVPFVCSDLANTGRLAESGNSFMGEQHLYYTCTLLLPSVVPILHHKYMTANVCLKFSGKVRADGIYNLKRFWMLNNLFSKSSDLSVLKGCNV